MNAPASEYEMTDDEMRERDRQDRIAWLVDIGNEVREYLASLPRLLPQVRLLVLLTAALHDVPVVHGPNEVTSWGLRRFFALRARVIRIGQLAGLPMRAGGERELNAELDALEARLQAQVFHCPTCGVAMRTPDTVCLRIPTGDPK